MRSLLLSTVLSICFSAQAATYPDRLIWVFGWNLNRDSDVTEISALLETAGKHHFTGAVVSFGLDTLCKKTPDFFQRLELVKKACDSNQLELIPAIFSVGYGGTALSHDRNLAEGLLVEQAPFLVEEGKAKFVPDTGVKFANGDFEEYRQNRISGFNFHDQPGEISFVDTEIKQSGRASIRLENFTANQHGHGRVMQEVRVKPHRCYRVSLWTRTESLQPLNAFQISVLTEKRSLAPRTFKLPETGDWQKHSFVFNSLTNRSVRIYAGIWGGKKGKLWLDNWIIEEVGPLNVLHRPGTPVTVANADNNIRYVEGKDCSSLGCTR